MIFTFFGAKVNKDAKRHIEAIIRFQQDIPAVLTVSFSVADSVTRNKYFVSYLLLLV